MEKLLIKNGMVVTPQSQTRADVLVCDGVIRAIGPDLESDAQTEVFDAAGCIVCCSLVDVHVHFRVPGRPDKETVLTGSRAAAHGGYGCVCPMPNLSPAPDTPEHLALEQRLIEEEAVIDVRPYATITLGREGKEVVDVKALKSGCIGFSDDGSGVQDEAVMRKAMETIASEGCILAAHCEDNTLLRGGYIHDGAYAAAHGHRGICSESEWKQIERDLRLAGETGCDYHVCHISTKESVELIRRAKAAGVRVSCETGPHYLVLTDSDLQEDGRFKMNPPLRSAEDRKALVEGLMDGTIDMIATDHAPHTALEKGLGLEKSAMGVVGLETAFPVMYTGFVENGRMSASALVELMSAAPRRRFRIGGCLAVGESADIAVFDVTKRWKIDPEEFLSKGKATPFEGMEVTGRCVLTLHKGKEVWKYLEQA